MKSNNKTGYAVRGGKIYVQGSIDGVFKRYSTGLEDTKVNLNKIKKIAHSELLRIHEEKTKPKKISTNFESYAIECLELTKDNRKEQTQKEYMAELKNKILPDFKNYDITQIGRKDLQVWQKKQTDKGLSGKTVNNTRGIFNYILNEAYNDGLIERNHFKSINRAKEIKVRDVQPFTLDEVKLILDSIDDCWQKDFIQIAFFSGMRTGEIVGLKWDDINFASKTINIKTAVRKNIESTPKTDASIRTIDMLPLVEKALLNQRKITGLKNSYIFLNTNGTHLFDGGIVRKGVWKNTLKLCGLDYRELYQTRHTFASMMISAGEDMLWVSKTLGHTNLNMTLSKYAKFVEDKKVKRASFLDDFNTKETAREVYSTTKTLKFGGM